MINIKIINIENEKEVIQVRYDPKEDNLEFSTGLSYVPTYNEWLVNMNLVRSEEPFINELSLLFTNLNRELERLKKEIIKMTIEYELNTLHLKMELN
jgi:hypothetical protein